MEEEIIETGSSLDENEEESDEQEEEEWSSYPYLPSNESNSLTHTLFLIQPKLSVALSYINDSGGLKKIKPKQKTNKRCSKFMR